MVDPDVLEGVMTVNEFMTILKLWREGQAAPFEDRLLVPPPIRQLD